MEYHIALAEAPETLINAVEAMMECGWLPCGGITSTTNEEVYSHDILGNQLTRKANTFYQAMTRTCKPNKTVKKSGLQPKAVIDLWNEVTKDSPLPRKLKIIAALEQSIRTRINEKDGFDTIEAWRSYFTAITRSNFLTGKNDRGWKADLEWAVKPKSITGVIEGKYHNG